MSRYSLEVTVGVFVFIGMLALGYLSVKLGRLELIGGGGYDIVAKFENIGGLKSGSSVEIAGVEVGRVTDIALSPNDYAAQVTIKVHQGVTLQDDAIASIKTKGLIGEKYVQITPGGSDMVIKPGGTLRETESAVDFESLISQFIFGSVEK